MLLVMIYCETQNGLKLRISRVFVTDDVGLLNYHRIHLNTYINIRKVLYEHRRGVHKNSRSFFKLANCSIHLFATRSCEWITNGHQRPTKILLVHSSGRQKGPVCSSSFYLPGTVPPSAGGDIHNYIQTLYFQESIVKLPPLFWTCFNPCKF